MMPKRIQRKRTKGWKMPPGAVYVGRPTKWGNPVKVVKSKILSGHYVISPQDAVERYRFWITKTEGRPLLHQLKELRGKDLVCWCALDAPCHADVLLRLANE